MKQIFVITILFTKLLVCKGNVESLNKLKEKVKALKGEVKVMKEEKQGMEINFMQMNPFMYPHLNKDKIEAMRKLWQDYYDCQQALYEASVRLQMPDARAFLEGTNAKLNCNVCQSPREIFSETRWFYSANNSMDHLTKVKLTPTVIMQNSSLHILNIKEAKGGLYVCSKGNHTARPYIVHIFKDEQSQKVVPLQNPKGPHPTPDVIVPDMGVTLITQWADWSQCSRCDQIGKRVREGICTVISNSNLQGLRSRRETHLPPFIQKMIEIKTTQTTESPLLQTDMSETSMESTTETESTEAKTTRETKPTTEVKSTAEATSTIEAISKTVTELTTKAKPIAEQFNQIESKEKTSLAQIVNNTSNTSLINDLKLISMFKEGIPCRSKLLSENFRNLQIVANRRSEVIVAFCQLSCPKSVIFVVVDEAGNIIETANNSDNVYSALQGLPQDIPAISRNVEFAIYKKPYKINCPGQRRGDIPVEWYVGRKAVTNTLLQKETNGRVMIDENQRIIFKYIVYEDSRIFSCWQRRDLVGTVRLRVEREITFNFQWTVQVIGISIVFILFLKIIYGAMKSERFFK